MVLPMVACIACWASADVLLHVLFHTRPPVVLCNVCICSFNGLGMPLHVNDGALKKRTKGQKDTKHTKSLSSGSKPLTPFIHLSSL